MQIGSMVATMLAEIYVLRLEAMARAESENRGHDLGFVPMAISPSMVPPAPERSLRDVAPSDQRNKSA